MSGLIQTAKEKIWKIASDYAQQQDIDQLKIGMVFYRDKGDQFITQPLLLSTDLDSVYNELLKISANGGGDAPESLNQALYEAVTLMPWSLDTTTYKTIFIVGDCPPHMDYQEVQYPESCQIAKSKNIIINTIKLGNSCHDAISHFKAIAECSNGAYLHLDQSASDYTIATPYDKEINELVEELEEDELYYGSHEEKAINESKKAKKLENISYSSSSSNSARASYKVSKAGKNRKKGKKDFLYDIENKVIDYDTIAQSELPKELQHLSKDEQKEKIDKLLLEKTRKKNSLKD